MENMKYVYQAIKLMKDTKDEMFGEEISHIEHAMQSYAYAIEHYPGDTELAVAAFWHDIGHSLFPHADKDHPEYTGPVSLMEKGKVVLGVMNHDVHAHNLLADSLPGRCTEMICYHTTAKRYCMDLESLSPASLETFHQEGGPLSAEERSEFEKNRFFKDCLLLRECDDAGKDPNFSYEKHGGREGLLLSAIHDTLILADDYTYHLEHGY